MADKLLMTSACLSALFQSRPRRRFQAARHCGRADYQQGFAVTDWIYYRIFHYFADSNRSCVYRQTGDNLTTDYGFCDTDSTGSFCQLINGWIWFLRFFGGRQRQLPLWQRLFTSETAPASSLITNKSRDSACDQRRETSDEANNMSAEFSEIPEILEDLRQGKLIVLVDDEDRENEGRPGLRCGKGDG